MSLLGNVFNKAANKTIPVYLSTSGPSFWRPTGAICEKAKNVAFDKTKAAFEGGNLFEEGDMKNTEKLMVTNMSHESDNDTNAHFTICAQTSTGAKVKVGHVQQDESKQTRSI